MADIKPLDKIAKKWSTVTPQRTEEYADGVANPRADWATKTQQAESAYNAGVNKAISEKRFAKGVQAAGTPTWQRKTIEKGTPRWAQGVAISAADYERGFQPYRETIARTTLPARGPKGDPANIQRVAILAKALHDTKMKGGR